MDVTHNEIGYSRADGAGGALPDEGVLLGEGDGGWFDVTGPDGGGPEGAGGSTENSGAGSDVENGLAGEENLFEQFETELGGLMLPSAEDVGSDHGEAEAAGRGGIVAIWRTEEKALADEEGLPVVPPDVALLGDGFDRGVVGGGEFFSSGGGGKEDLVADSVLDYPLDGVVVGPVGEEVFPLCFRAAEAYAVAHYSRLSALTRQ